MGITLSKLEKYHEAVEWFDKAIEIDGKFALAYYNRGYAHGMLQKYEDAKET